MAGRKRATTTTATRTIFFYRLDVGLDEKGERFEFPTSEVLKHVNSLAFETGERYLDTGDEFDSSLCLWVSKASGKNQTAILGKSRKGGFPEVGDHKGNYRR